MDCPRNNLALITLDADAWRLREHQLALITSDSRCCSTTSNNIDYSHGQNRVVGTGREHFSLSNIDYSANCMALITSDLLSQGRPRVR